MKFHEFEDKMREVKELQSKIWGVQRILDKAHAWDNIRIEHYDGHINELNISFGFLKNGMIEALNMLITNYNDVVKKMEEAGVEFENPYKDVKPVPDLATQLSATQYKLRELEEKYKKLEEDLNGALEERDNYHSQLKEIWRKNGNNN